MIEVGKLYTLCKLRSRSREAEGTLVRVDRIREDDEFSVVAADGGKLLGFDGMVVSSRQLLPA